MLKRSQQKAAKLLKHKLHNIIMKEQWPQAVALFVYFIFKRRQLLGFDFSLLPFPKKCYFYSLN